jgi:PAS domain S-box-containing protein
MYDRDDDIEPLRSTVAARAVDPDHRSSALRRMVAELVLETTNEGIWLIDAQARTTFVNRAAAELLGYSEEEMIGRHIFDFMDEDRRPIAQENLMRRQRGVEERQAVELRRKDGARIWVIGSTNPVYDRHGRYAGALALLGDLTHQKRTEAELRARIAELSAKAGETMLEAQTSQSQPQPQAPPADAPPPRASLMREGLRALSLLAAGGAFVSAVGLLTVAGVVGALLGADAPIVPPES